MKLILFYSKCGFGLFRDAELNGRRALHAASRSANVTYSLSAGWMKAVLEGGQAAGPCLCGCRERRWLPFWTNTSPVQPVRAKTTPKTKKDKASGKFRSSFNDFMSPRGLRRRRAARHGSALSLPAAPSHTPARLAATLALTGAVSPLTVLRLTDKLTLVLWVTFHLFALRLT